MDISDYRELTYSNENKILSYYRDSDDSVLTFPSNNEVKAIYNATHDKENWGLWIDSAGKADKTPDFFCDDRKIMMEVMRFDDKADKKGKVNLTLARETELLNMLSDNEILDSFPNIQHIFLGADTKLSTNEDHNFKRFRANFLRVIEKHSRQVETYRKNHPDYKLIFFIFDETSGVYYKKINLTQAQHHFYWADSILVKAIKDSGADFVIWFKPYNAYLTPEGMKQNLPRIMIYDVVNMTIDVKCYDADQMISSEK